MASTSIKSLAVVLCLSATFSASLGMAQALVCDNAFSTNFGVEFDSISKSWSITSNQGEKVQLLSSSEQLPSQFLVGDRFVTWMVDQKLKSFDTYTGHQQEMFMGSIGDRKVLSTSKDGSRALVLHPHTKTPSIYVFDFNRKTNLEIGGLIRRSTHSFNLDFVELGDISLGADRHAVLDTSLDRVAFNNASGFIEVYSVSQNKSLAQIMGHANRFSFSTSGKFLLMMNSDNGLTVANVETGTSYTFRNQELLGNGRKIISLTTKLYGSKESLEVITEGETPGTFERLKYNLSR